MKKFFLIFAIAIVFSCDNSNGDRNPYLIEPGFSFDINLNLPLYAGLNTPGNSIYIGNNGVGVKGVIVYNSGFGTFFAWEASCPNHSPSNCSTMTISGATCKCNCEGYTYSLVNGFMTSKPDSKDKLYGLLNYRVTTNGNNLKVFN